MQKQAPTLGRMLVMVGFALSCFGLLLFLWLAFGGPIPLKPKGYQVEVPFQEGTQLAVEADVRVSGVAIGKVKTVETNKITGNSIARLQIDERYAPLSKDVRAVLRQKTLLGETYVELTPGNPRTAGTIAEGDRLPAAQVSPTVELDEIFRAFDPKTRQAFQTWMQQQSRSLDGRSRDISDIIGNLDPFAQETTELLKVLNAQTGAVSRLVDDTGTVFEAISDRRGQLRSLIDNNERVFSTTARRENELRQLFTVFPTFNREAKQTVERLTAFAKNTDPLVTQLRPAAREFSPTFEDFAELAPDLRGLLSDLDPLITASQKGLPALRKFLQDFRPALGEFDPTLKQLNPILSYLGSNRDEIRAFFSNVPAATQASSPNGIHYLRTLNPLNPENLAVYPRRIGSNRTNGTMKPGGYRDIAKGGLLSFDTRSCGNPNPTTADQPTLSQQLKAVLPYLVGPGETAPPKTDPLAPPAPTSDALATNIINFMFSNAGRNTPRPRCAQQGAFTVNEGKVSTTGVTSQYPHVLAAASSTRAPK